MCDRSSCSWSVTKIIEEVSRVYRDRRKFSLVILFSIDASLLLCNFLVLSPMLVLRNSDDRFSNGRLFFCFLRRYRVSGCTEWDRSSTRVWRFGIDAFPLPGREEFSIVVELRLDLIACHVLCVYPMYRTCRVIDRYASVFEEVNVRVEISAKTSCERTFRVPEL